MGVVSGPDVIHEEGKAQAASGLSSQDARRHKVRVRRAHRVAIDAACSDAPPPTPRPDDVVILDNLPAHKGRAIQAAVEARGAHLHFLPPSSPEPKDRVSDFNPIEQAFAKLKALLRKAAECGPT